MAHPVQTSRRILRRAEGRRCPLSVQRWWSAHNMREITEGWERIIRKHRQSVTGAQPHPLVYLLFISPHLKQLLYTPSQKTSTGPPLKV